MVKISGSFGPATIALVVCIDLHIANCVASQELPNTMLAPAQCITFSFTLKYNFFGMLTFLRGNVVLQFLIIFSEVHNMKFSLVIPECHNGRIDKRTYSIDIVSCLDLLHN